MRGFDHPRRLVALAAAYLIVLQVLLLPLSVTLGGGTDFSLCSSAASAASSQSPANHQTGCPCAAGCGMQCCVHAFGGPPQAFLAIEPTPVDARPLPPALAPVVHLTVRTPQFARGPPSA
jgi:hypothetical protein